MATPGVPRWGKVDPSAAATALGVSITFAVLLTISVLVVGWLYAPGERKEIVGGLRGAAAPIWNSRPSQCHGRFQTQPSVVSAPL